MNITTSRGLHLNPPSLSIPTPSHSHHKSFNPKRKSGPCSWADIVEEGPQHSKDKYKKQRLSQIMNWTNQKHTPKPTLTTKQNKQYEHKDGNKLTSSILVALGDGKKGDSVYVEDEDNNVSANTSTTPPPYPEGPTCDAQMCDAQPCDAQSCDSQSTLSSDAISCDTLSSCDSIEGEGQQKKRRKRKGKKRNYSTAEEGKKLFVGGIKFEDCDALLSNNNETLEALRHQKFSQIFYLFGAVNRVQGHWSSGYCFVVFSTQKAAKLAFKCLALAPVRRKVVQNLRDGVGPTGILPLPSFYVRWANNPSSSPRPATPTPISPLPSPLSSLSSSPVTTPLLSSIPPIALPVSEKEEMDWLDDMKEESMEDKDVERLMAELLKLRD
jgi:hypothetical protein